VCARQYTVCSLATAAAVKISLKTRNYQQKTCMASEAKISIEREVLNVQRFNELYPDRRATNDTKNLKAVCRQLKNCVKSPFKHPGVSIKAFFLRLLPILRWLPHYDIKECLVSDIISGITVGVMQIPQGKLCN